MSRRKVCSLRMSDQKPATSRVSPTRSSSLVMLSRASLVAAPQPDRRHVVAGAELGAHQRPADHARALGQHHLDHADLLRPVGEVGAAQRQQLEPELARQLLGIGVAGRTGRSAARRRRAAAWSPTGRTISGANRPSRSIASRCAPDRVAQAQLLERPPGQRRAVLDPHPPLAARRARTPRSSRAGAAGPSGLRAASTSAESQRRANSM